MQRPPAYVGKLEMLSSRHIEPEALARLVGWSTTLKALAQPDALLAVRDEGGAGGGGREAEGYADIGTRSRSAGKQVGNNSDRAAACWGNAPRSAPP
jgi:hypothetical protein